MEPCEPHPKRGKVGIQLKNGHDCIFKEELPKYLQVECSICLCVLDDPHIIDCKCGASFCRSCIQPTLKEKRPCPLCNSSFSVSIPNSSVQRAINSLQVYCSSKEAGCEWVGELRALTRHLNDDIESDSYKSSGCPCLLLNCGYCNGEFQRQHMFGHETNECLKRPYVCGTCNDFESTFEDVMTNHIDVCPCGLVPCPNVCGVSLQRKCIDDHLADNCPLEIVSCSFSHIGCEEKLPREDMLAHINGNLALHLSLLAISHQSQLDELQVQIRNLEDEVKALRSKEVEHLKFISAHLRIMPVTIIVNEFLELKRNGSHWQSKPFYSHPYGYKMSLIIYCNGYGEGEGRHISASFSLLYGEFDDKLEWPFRGAVSIKLLDQKGTGHHFCRTLSFDNAPERYTRRVAEGDVSRGWGFLQFISHADLSRYLKNNSLCFILSLQAD